MARGDDPASIVRTLTAADSGRDHRQLHMIDKAGRIAAHTGSACIDWCGHRAGTRLLGRRQHARRAARARRDGRGLRSASRATLRAAPPRRYGRRRSRRRRQARQAGGGADRLHDGELPRARPPRRRPRGAHRRASAPVRKEPRAVPAVRLVPAAPRQSGRHHRPRRHRGRSRALPGSARPRESAAETARRAGR